MKQRKSLRLLSMLLAFIMVLELMPVQAFATEGAYETTAETFTSNEPSTSQDVYIQNEIPALRSEYAKHYRQTDGTFVVTSFQVPIHYEENGQWENINNELQPVAMFDGTEVYQAVNGDHTQAFAATLETGDILSIFNDETALSMSLWDGFLIQATEPEDLAAEEEIQETEAPEESPMEDETSHETEPPTEDLGEDEKSLETTIPEDLSAEQEIPTDISAVEELTQESEAQDESPMEDEPSQESETPTETLTEETLSSWTEILPEDVLEDEPPQESEPLEESPDEVEDTDSQATDFAYAVFNRDAEAQVQADDDVLLMSIMDDAEESPLTVETAIDDVYQNLTSTVIYEEVYPGVDLRYDLHGFNVKESIILKEAQPETDSYTYGFMLKLDGLSPVLMEDGSITIFDSENNAQYVIPAPFMEDSNKAYSDAVTYTLTQHGDSWLLTVQADETWLEDPERVYPVTIDPTIIEAENESAFVGCSATEYYYDHSTWHALLDDELAVGYNDSAFGQMEMFFKITQLPAIPDGTTVIDANVGMLLSDYTPQWESSAKSILYIHEITEEFDSDNDWPYGVEWDQRPTYGKPMDYIETHGGEIRSYLLWNITRVAKKWYANPATNYGLAVTSNQTSATAYRAYFDFVDEAVLTVSYRDTTGTEPYFTYETQSAVRAGTGYVGDYASTLTVVKNDFSYSNTAMPFGFNHVFNNSLRNGELNYYEVTNTDPGIFVPDYSAMKTGKGWQLSLQESVLRTTIKGPNDERILYLIYRDGDGTQHFFTYDYDETVYKDEDGLGLTIYLPESASGTNDIYELRYENGDTKHFRDGYLVCIEDADGNKIHLVYNNHTYVSGSDDWGLNTSGNQLTSLFLENHEKDGTTICRFTYDGGYLNTIVDYAGRTTEFDYLNGRLESITHPDNVVTTYSYNSDGGLTKMYDGEAKYGIEYSYNDGGVSGIKEYAISGSTVSYGTKVLRTKSDIQDTVYQYSGNDGILSNASTNSDDLYNHYAFDYIGRTINITTLSADGTILGISSGAYTTATGRDERVNRISKSSQAGQASENLLEAAGIETHDSFSSVGSKWLITKSGTWQNAVVKEGDITRTGTASLETWLGTENTSAVPQVGMYQTVYLTADQTYNFSGYVNTQGITFFDGGGAYLAFLSTSNQILAAGDKVTVQTTDTIEDGWQRIQVTYTPTSSGNYRVAAMQQEAYGSAFFDDLQLEQVWGAVSGSAHNVSLKQDSAPSNVNLVQNGAFIDGAQEWTMGGNGTGSESGSIHPNFANLIASADGMKRVSQTIPINAPATETFLLSGWGKAAAAANCESKLENATDNDKRYFGLIARCNYSDDSDEYFYMPFNDDYTGWQHSSCVIVPSEDNQSKTVESITVILAYDNNINEAHFTDISLRREPCTTYTYDDEGNVIATNSTGNDAELMEYAAGSSRIEKQTTTANGTTTYQYRNENNENQVTEIVNDGVGVQFGYDESGNSTSTLLTTFTETTENGKTVYNPSGTSGIRTSAVYSADGSQLMSQTNANGYKTSYTYDATRQLLSTSMENGPITYSYYHVNTTRPSLSYISGMVSLNYTYESGLLSSVVRGGYFWTNNVKSEKQTQTYSMEYDAWGNTTSVSVGGIELVSYTYGANNGPLQTMTYGSGDWVEYSYDNLGRVTVEQHLNESDNVTATYQYFYNSEGVLAKKLDVGTGKAVNYEYDSLGRLIRSWETYGNTIEQKTEHLYDTSNRLIEQSWQLGVDIYSESYVYNSDGTLYMVDSDDFYQYGFGYDSLKRLSYRQNWLYRQTYSYRDIDADTTGQITDISYTSRGGGTEFDAFTLSYEYDTLGNIKKITDSDDNVTEYTYDVQGQMTKEIVNDVITEYVYDTYGNIRQVKDSNGNVLHTYTYGDANWLDKLTAYDGTAIVYDEVGNPTLYTNGKNQWGMQWNNGRQLIRAACADYTATYTYDQDGIRDSKTVGTTTYNYITQNGKVVRQTWGSNVMDFIYDNTGRPYCCVYNGTKYYYICNLQGDVIRIVDTSGATVAEYSYDAWGNVLSVTGSMKTSLGADNPIRYRGYYYDAETGFYYLQSRYYDPTIGRFINADTFTSTGQGFLGYNMFAYCANNPSNTCDTQGTAVETVFDIISLGASIVEVAVDPWDPWAWLGLLGDVADVAIPCVGGLGEAVDALKAMNVIDQSVDVAKLTTNTLNAISVVANATSVGGDFVYTAFQPDQPDVLEYVGITNDFGRRHGEWGTIREINPYISGIDRDTARCAEQTIISLFGRNGNILSNIRNSIGVNGKLKGKFIDFFTGLL